MHSLGTQDDPTHRPWVDGPRRMEHTDEIASKARHSVDASATVLDEASGHGAETAKDEPASAHEHTTTGRAPAGTWHVAVTTRRLGRVV